MASSKTQYLIAYNGLSAALWAVLLAQVILLLSTTGYANVYSSVGSYARWVQTLAIAEILHSAFGIVRAPLFTTLTQVASRLLLVHAIVHPFPNSAGHGNPFYSSMLLAWSVTEVIRYSFFVKTLSQGSTSKTSGPAGSKDIIPVQGKQGAEKSLLTWLRYNTFFVLYPVGISSEVACIWKAMGEMKRRAGGQLATSGDGLYGLGWWASVGVLAVYVPGSYVLYTYMMAQRKKVVGGSGKSSKSSKKTR